MSRRPHHHHDHRGSRTRRAQIPGTTPRRIFICNRRRDTVARVGTTEPLPLKTQPCPSRFPISNRISPPLRSERCPCGSMTSKIRLPNVERRLSAEHFPSGIIWILSSLVQRRHAALTGETDHQFCNRRVTLRFSKYPRRLSASCRRSAPGETKIRITTAQEVPGWVLCRPMELVKASSACPGFACAPA
jgi:hypothetical protein